jgi:glycosyltransferase involved in cell wall biosynthesis
MPLNILKIYFKNAKILIVGPTPPPFGGVSVHINRLKMMILKNGHQVDLFYTSKKFKSKILNSIKLAYLILKNNYNIIHIHHYFRFYMLVVFVMKFIKNYKVYFTDHNPRLFEKKSKAAVFLLKIFIEKLDYLIVVSGHVLDGYNRNEVKMPENLLIQEAFLPPMIEEEDRIFQMYSQKTKIFLSTHKPLIVANGNIIVFYKKHDLYGLDICIELTNKLKCKFPQIGFIFVLSQTENNNDYLKKMKSRIDKYDLTQNFLIMVGQCELWPLISKSDLCIRPTMSDGDSLTIREALYLNCPVIASDVSPRPNGTILFKSRNIEDLYSKTIEVLNNK